MISLSGLKFCILYRFEILIIDKNSYLSKKLKKPKKTLNLTTLLIKVIEEFNIKY